MITFEEAYAIDARVYNGETVTDAEREQVREVILHMHDKSADYSWGQLLWAAYSIKDYPAKEVTNDNASANIR